MTRLRPSELATNHTIMVRVGSAFWRVPGFPLPTSAALVGTRPATLPSRGVDGSTSPAANEPPTLVAVRTLVSQAWEVSSGRRGIPRVHLALHAGFREHHVSVPRGGEPEADSRRQDHHSLSSPRMPATSSRCLRKASAPPQVRTASAASRAGASKAALAKFLVEVLARLGNRDTHRGFSRVFRHSLKQQTTRGERNNLSPRLNGQFRPIHFFAAWWTMKVPSHVPLSSYSTRKRNDLSWAEILSFPTKKNRLLAPIVVEYSQPA